MLSKPKSFLYKRILYLNVHYGAFVELNQRSLTYK